MAFSLKRSEHITQSIRRIVAEQLQFAIENLRLPEVQRLAGVHQARKCLKRLRAILRLLSPGAGDWRSQAETTFKSISSRLSNVRHADAIQLLFEDLQRTFANEVAPEVFAAARKCVPTTECSVPLRSELEARLPEIIRELQGQLDQLENWDLSETSPRSVFRKIRKRYRLGRTAFRHAAREQHFEQLHDWRKCCKDLHYQLQLFQKVWPAVMHCSSAEAGRLCDLLGEDHDLALFRESLVEHARDNPAATQLSPLIDRIDRYRAELWLQEWRLGSLLFAEKPKAFARRLARYWEIWKTKRQ